MVMTQANSLERTKIQQALYSILGQDYKHSHVPNPSRWSSSSRPSGKGRADYVDKDGNNYDDDAWGYMAEDDDAVYCEYDDAAWEGDGNYMMSSTAKQSTTRRTWPTASWMTMAMILTNMMSALC